MRLFGLGPAKYHFQINILKFFAEILIPNLSSFLCFFRGFFCGICVFFNVFYGFYEIENGFYLCRGFSKKPLVYYLKSFQDFLLENWIN